MENTEGQAHGGQNSESPKATNHALGGAVAAAIPAQPASGPEASPPQRTEKQPILHVRHALDDARLMKSHHDEEKLHIPSSDMLDSAPTCDTNGHDERALFEKYQDLPANLDTEPSILLTRASTLCFPANGQAAPLTGQFQSSKIADGEVSISDSNDECIETETPRSTPSRSNSQPDSDGPDFNPNSPSSLTEERHENAAQGLQDELNQMVGLQSHLSGHHDQPHLSIARDTYRGSGTQGIPLNSVTRNKASVTSRITDAGDQQFIQQKHASGRGQAEDEPIPDVPYGSDYSSANNLNCQLFAALQETRDSREKGFLPKAQLDTLINQRSVFIELAKFLRETMTDSEIQECAKTVCVESKVTLTDGRSKLRSFRKIFALLVLLEKPASIPLFIKEDVSDLDLPLSIVRNGGSFELRRKDTSDKRSDEPLKCFRGWAPVWRKSFEEYQWTMLAPFFVEGEYNHVRHYVLTDHHILPFVYTKDEEDDNAEYHGGFGRVFMVRLHRDHHNFRDQVRCERGFAIKQLKQNDPVSFEREVNILKKFVGIRCHPHIVSLLATYEQFNKFHLMFYRAEGNLFKYWKEIDPHPEFNYGRVLWMAEQCAGIAHGLLQLHKHSTIVAASTIPNRDAEEDFKRRSTGEKQRRATHQGFLATKNIFNSSTKAENPPVEPVSPTFIPTAAHRFGQQTDERDARLVHEPLVDDLVRKWGRHGDLKPENILWYSDSKSGAGSLKISDFGEAELNSRASKSKSRSQLANTMTYRPPECDLQPKIIRQSYDIWCLGCVYMEFITWMLGGVELWEEFAMKRLSWDIFQQARSDTFFELVKSDTDEVSAMVKKAVTEVSIYIKGILGEYALILASFLTNYTRMKTAPTTFTQF